MYNSIDRLAIIMIVTLTVTKFTDVLITVGVTHPACRAVGEWSRELGGGHVDITCEFVNDNLKNKSGMA